jgi:hypothetical protein
MYYSPSTSEYREMAAYEMEMAVLTEPAYSLEALQALGREIGVDVETLSSATEFDLGVCQRLKEAQIRFYVDHKGSSEEAARTYIEEKTTFRSLLMGRTSQYRAEATEGDARLFCGAFHGKEVERFLSDHDFLRQYTLTEFTDKMRSIYRANEVIQKAVTDAFEAHRYKFDPLLHTEFLRWVAYQSYRGYLSNRDNIIINVDDFMNLLINRSRKPAKVGRNAPCPCGSGAKYKRCHGK